MAVDLTTNELVKELARTLRAELAPSVVDLPDEATKSAVQTALGELTDDDLIGALAAGGDVPELEVYAGFLGPTLQDRSGATWVILYLDWKLQTWLLLPESGIIRRATVELAEKMKPPLEHDVLWLRADAPVRSGSGPESREARFLQGGFVTAGDFTDSLPGSTFAGVTGVFCQARSPGCCGPRTR